MQSIWTPPMWCLMSPWRCDHESYVIDTRDDIEEWIRTVLREPAGRVVHQHRVGVAVHGDAAS